MDEMENKIDNNIISVFELQKKFVASRKSLNINYRIDILKKLKANILKYEKELCDALQKDLNKSPEESYMCEIGLVLEEISHMLKHIKKYAKPQKFSSAISNFPSKSYIKKCPYGVVFILSPWNYPFMLSLIPIIDAISAGNSVILRSSEFSPNVSQFIKKLVDETFERGCVDVVLGGRDVATQLLELDFDYIFYTGSTRVGEIVLKKAAEHFTPVTLEMGGKSPCIVDETANVPLSAKRIVFGKFLNAGQTCVAPDFVYCDKKIKDQLILEIEKEIVKQYSTHPLKNPNFPKMINQKQFDAMKSFITKENIIFGGKVDSSSLKIEPTILNATFDDKVMKEEIFGPILPIVTFENLDEAIFNINNKLTKPLALYIFSNSKINQQKVENYCDFGGGCVNDTVIHIANSNLPFGGIKQSGMGAYHGKFGFETFTHFKSIVKRSTRIDLPFRYQPIGKFKKWLIKKFLK